jgi:hypothetical protein
MWKFPVDGIDVAVFLVWIKREKGVTILFQTPTSWARSQWEDTVTTSNLSKVKSRKKKTASANYPTRRNFADIKKKYPPRQHQRFSISFSLYRHTLPHTRIFTAQDFLTRTFHAQFTAIRTIYR